MAALLSPQDIEDVRSRGLTADEVQRQQDLLSANPPLPVLDRPCSMEDGILSLKPEEAAGYTHLFDKAREEGRLSKFVPASGAATRMFKALLAWRKKDPDVLRSRVERASDEGDPDAAEVFQFILELPRFPFFDALRAHLQDKGLNPSGLLSEGRYGPWAAAILDKGGLELASLPKALFPFHRVKEGVRTALEEHLVESVDTLRDGEGACRLHFTVLEEHVAAFNAKVKEALPALERSRRCRFRVESSLQKASTDTVALEADGRLARRKDGRILFRPGGHGALIENLNDLKGDLVYIKNIDNVGHESRPGETSHWDALLAGLLLDLQFHLYQRASWLTSRPRDTRILMEAEDFAARRLNIRPPAGHAEQDPSTRREWLLARFNRPLRVCAVVKNTGEPGGGPFWVKEADGAVTAQIIESAQVSDDLAQKKIFQSSTHFNPVHMVCALRNADGENHDLRRFTDPAAVFIAEKSVDGRPLKVLERPGLWNGAMARWTTVFVDAPLSIFHPVKTVNDLLRPDHQPA
jgi:hypothetical protein